MTIRINPHADGLVRQCANCTAHPVRLDYVVDDEFWNTHVPEEFRADVVCLTCLCAMSGTQALDHLQILYFTVGRDTVALIPVSLKHITEEEKS